MKKFGQLPMTDCPSSSVSTLMGEVLESDLQSPEAMQESLQNLLTIPIEFALNHLPQALGDKLRQRSAASRVATHAQDAGINTFGDLLKHAEAPVAMLEFAKEFGKAVMQHKRTVWPTEVGQVLYYSAYAAALVRWRNRLGTLNKSELEHGFRQLGTQQWIGEELRALLKDARKCLAKM